MARVLAFEKFSQMNLQAVMRWQLPTEASNMPLDLWFNCLLALEFRDTLWTTHGHPGKTDIWQAPATFTPSNASESDVLLRELPFYIHTMALVHTIDDTVFHHY